MSGTVREIAEYLYSEADGDINYLTELTYEDFADYYGNISLAEFDKAVDIVNNLIDNVEYYTSDGVRYLQLNDNRTLWHVENENFTEEDYYDLTATFFEMFEDETGVRIYSLGRSGRHICVEDTLENALRYEELVSVQNRLEDEFIKEANAIEGSTAVMAEGNIFNRLYESVDEVINTLESTFPGVEFYENNGLIQGMQDVDGIYDVVQEFILSEGGPNGTYVLNPTTDSVNAIEGEEGEYEEGMYASSEIEEVLDGQLTFL